MNKMRINLKFFLKSQRFFVMYSYFLNWGNLMLYLSFADWIWLEFYLKNLPVPHGKHTPSQLWQLVLCGEIFIVCLRLMRNA
jgi:hypothetical protein